MVEIFSIEFYQNMAMFKFSLMVWIWVKNEKFYPDSSFVFISYYFETF